MSTASAASLSAAKKSIRAAMKASLSGLSTEYIATSSTSCFDRLRSTDQYRKSTAICCYLSMKNEIQTYKFIEEAMLDGKVIYIPKVTGPLSGDMMVILLESMESINSFPRSKWGIPEPPEDYLRCFPDVSADAVFDLVVVPGVAFDIAGGRIGHGKGYYDCFLAKCEAASALLHKPRPITIGVGFDEQIIDSVPMTETDRKLDLIVTPSFISDGTDVPIS